MTSQPIVIESSECVECELYPTHVAEQVAAMRPDLCSGDAVAAVLTAAPALRASEVIEILDAARIEFAEESMLRLPHYLGLWDEP